MNAKTIIVQTGLLWRDRAKRAGMMSEMSIPPCEQKHLFMNCLDCIEGAWLGGNLLREETGVQLQVAIHIKASSVKVQVTF